MSTHRTASRFSAPAPRQKRLVINRAPDLSEVQRRLERDRRRYSAGMVDPDQFASELAVEFARRQRGGRNCALASISIFEIAGIRHRFGPELVFDLVTELMTVVLARLGPGDVVNLAENGEILVLGRDSPVSHTVKQIDEICREVASRRWDAGGENLLLTPSAGVATLDDGVEPSTVVRRAVDAREVAAGHLDLRVHRWEPAMSTDTALPDKEPFDRFRWQAIKEKLRAPSQIFATYVLGLFVPFCIYWFSDAVIGIDISWPIYLFCVATLVSTGVMILVEARLAIRQKEPPEVESYPPASAIICAYLPNEAATIMETLDAFLNQGYPGGLQVILAYNTPSPMAVERELHRLADERDDLEVVKVEGSTSKAQNVNAVLHMATGEFTGMFDADHMPRPGSFERSWRWLANGYDVVQGHCLTRNGDETWLAKMIAVEFESIYAVAHPGRAKLHRFGVFGGSNGYWRTDLLHETRMRGSMLTEDIDSSMRTVERGLKIRSDRDVVSRELGTTTMKQVWNQRLRWAQGWFQVTMMHTLRVWRSPGLTFRQKVGATYLLGWREVYPWLSLQVFPLVAFWLITRGDQLSYGWPIFFFTTIFVLHVGPHQTWYAYKLADPEIKQHKSWFWGYLLFSTLFYTEYKNTIARVAHIKEWVGERAWKVTPRSDDPIEFDDSDDIFGDDDATGADRGDDTIDESLAPRRVRGPLAAELVPSDAPDDPSGDGAPTVLPRRSIVGEPLVGTSSDEPVVPAAGADSLPRRGAEAPVPDGEVVLPRPERTSNDDSVVAGDALPQRGAATPSSEVAIEPLPDRESIDGEPGWTLGRAESERLADAVAELRQPGFVETFQSADAADEPDTAGALPRRTPRAATDAATDALPRRRRPVSSGQLPRRTPPTGETTESPETSTTTR